jgi:hypothetical protein
MWPFKPDPYKKIGAFSKYISRESFNKFLEDGANMPPLRNGVVDFLLFQVKDEGFDSVVNRLAEGIDLILSKEGVVVASIPPIVLATFGFPREDGDGGDLRRVAANALANKLNDSVKVVHGRVQGMYGFVGTTSRMCYVPILPSFDTVLKKLGELKLGETCEFNYEPVLNP